MRRGGKTKHVAAGFNNRAAAHLTNFLPGGNYQSHCGGINHMRRGGINSSLLAQQFSTAADVCKHVL